jgi:hypothetical protein
MSEPRSESGALPETFRAAVWAEFQRASRPPYEVPLVVLGNGLLVVVFWFSRFNAVMFSLHGALAFPVVLGSWMYSDVPATNVLGSDGRRVLEAGDDIPMLMRLLAAKSALLWLAVAPGCVLIATIIGIVDGRLISATWTVIAIAVVPLGALALSDWVGILWPYHPISLSARWRDRRKVGSQLRWLVLILAPYIVVPAVFVAVSLPALAWWRISTDGVVSRIPDSLFGQLTVIAGATSLAVWFAARAGSRRLLRSRRARLRAYLSEADPE